MVNVKIIFIDSIFYDLLEKNLDRYSDILILPKNMAIFRKRWKSLPCKYRDKAVIFDKNLVN